MRRVRSVVLLAASLIFLKGAGMAADPDQVAVIETKFGKIVVEFFTADTPKTVANFLKLAKAGFYDGTTFHRVMPGFIPMANSPRYLAPASVSSISSRKASFLLALASTTRPSLNVSSTSRTWRF